MSHLFQDVMQVCRNGHVVTDRLRTCPDRTRHYCERCGATTVYACLTCGRELPGAVVVPGLDPVGTRAPPQFCAACGAPFPWHPRPAHTVDSAAATLETFLRRLPYAVRRLRERWGTRAPLRVEDEHDLEDLVRSLLPLSFDGVRLRSRTPSYARDTRTDFLIHSPGMVVTVKSAAADLRPADVERQLEEDTAHYRSVVECRTLWAYVFDPQGRLRGPRELEALWSRAEAVPSVRCVISG